MMPRTEAGTRRLFDQCRFGKGVGGIDAFWEQETVCCAIRSCRQLGGDHPLKGKHHFKKPVCCNISAFRPPSRSTAGAEEGRGEERKRGIMLQGTPSLRRGLIALQLLLAVLVVAFPMLEAFEIAGSTRTAFASLPLLRAAMAAPTSTRISRQVAHMSSTDDVTASRPKKVCPYLLSLTGDPNLCCVRWMSISLHRKISFAFLSPPFYITLLVPSSNGSGIATGATDTLRSRSFSCARETPARMWDRGSFLRSSELPPQVEHILAPHGR